MTTLFGFPMSGIEQVLFGAFLAVTVAVAVLAARNRLFLRLALRNIPRRRAQSILIVFGLMLSTAIITSAFGAGDTMSYSFRSLATSGLGPVDEMVRADTGAAHRPFGGPAVSRSKYFAASRAAAINSALKGGNTTDGVTGAIVAGTSLRDLSSRETKAQAGAIGVPATYAAGFGPLITDGGRTVSLASLHGNQVYLNHQAAYDLGAHAGDRVRLFVSARPATMTVAAVLTDQGLAAGGVASQNGVVGPVAVMRLGQMQAMAGHPGQVNTVLISNRGGTIDGAALTSAVVHRIAPVLGGAVPLHVSTVKKHALVISDRIGTEFTAGFITFGLFSIAAGIVLIFLLFVMLAAERRPEMGMARAVGTKRRHLVQQFLFEGYVYDLGAAVVGVALGIVVGLGLVSVIANLLSSVNTSIQITQHVELRSIIVAFCLGALMTFITVAGSCWHVSRLNIVAAIRDLPDETQIDRSIRAAFTVPLRDLTAAWRRGRRGKLVGASASLLKAPWHLITAFRTFISRGPILLLGGYLLFQMGNSDRQGFPYFLGISLMLIGVSMLVRWLLGVARVPDRVRNRIGFSLAGLSLVVFWLLPFDTFRSDLSVGIEMFFLSGMMLILGGVWTVMYNIDLLAVGFLAITGGFSRLAPMLRMALTYPTQHRLRTGLTLFMFSLVVFALMVEAVLTGSFGAETLNLNRDIGGYQVYATASSGTPIPNLQAAVRQNPSLRGRVTAAGAVGRLDVALQQGSQKGWEGHTALVADNSYLAGTHFSLYARAGGFGSDRSVWRMLRTHPGYAVASADLATVPDGSGQNAAYVLKGLTLSHGTFAPVHVRMLDRRTGRIMPLTIVGLLDPGASNFEVTNGLYIGAGTLAAAHDRPVAPSTYLFRVAPGQDVHAAALKIGSAFLAYGLDVTESRVQYDQNLSTNVAFNQLLEAFMALGLVVGIAAVGVVATRAVVERRQQIGLLRAIGFKAGMVRLSFLLESSVVALLGTGIGTLLGLLLSYQVVSSFHKSDPALYFTVPWLEVVLIVVGAYVASLLTTFLPAWQASRVYPAEALRYE